MSHTSRTATEQLLLTDAIDRAVDEIDFSPLAGKRVLVDRQYFGKSTDEMYALSTLRQKLAATGCRLTDRESDADLIVEARMGVLGTDSYSMVVGIPAVEVPSGLAAVAPGAAAIPSIPEVPIVKRSEQRGVVKLAVFAYGRESGKAVWQSGSTPHRSTSHDLWVLGAGPFQNGSIYDRPEFAGSSLESPKLLPFDGTTEETMRLQVTQAAYFEKSEGKSSQAKASGGAKASIDDAAPGLLPAPSDSAP